MKKYALIFSIILCLVLTACSGTSSTGNGSSGSNASGSSPETTATTPSPSATPAPAAEPEKPATVDITDATGTVVTVPVNPERVVVLDNRSFETLESWGIQLAAVPKAVIPTTIGYKNDDSAQDIGNHREPKLEIIAAVDPELVIVGQRFAGFYEDIKKLVPNAAVINLNIDVSAKDGTSGQNLVNGFKDITLTLGKIFDKNDEAQALVAEFEKSIENAKASYNQEDTVMSVIVSGGNIGYSSPGNGRVWGPLYDILGWKSALDVAESTSDHQGDEVSVEAIAQSNPDWLFVMDRDAAPELHFTKRPGS